MTTPFTHAEQIRCWTLSYLDDFAFDAGDVLGGRPFDERQKQPLAQFLLHFQLQVSVHKQPEALVVDVLHTHNNKSALYASD